MWSGSPLVPIDADVGRLTLSCLLLGFVGPEPPRWLLDLLGDGLGGVVLFGSNLGDGREDRRLTDRLRTAAGRDIVVALDEEGGDVTRLDTLRGSASPGAAALGHLDDPAATEEAYVAIGARLVEAGVTTDLAPVADVNVEALNPVIGVRSFGSDPDLVGRHVAAAVRGLQRCGVAACAKHFPGHGASTSDSHHEVATLQRTRRQLYDVELPPFRSAVDAGTRAVMTGHLFVPALDPDGLATVSRPVVELLRDDLEFGGAIVTDALEMRAVSGTIGMVEGFVQALAAGADAIETGARDYPEFVAEVTAAVEVALDDGRLPRARLEWAARRTASLATPGDPAVRPDGAVLSTVPARCLEVIGRLPRLMSPLVVECRPPGGMASGELPWSLAEPLGGLVPGVDAVAVRRVEDAAGLAERARGRSLVVVVRDPARHAWQAEVLAAAGGHAESVVVDVGWPTEVALVHGEQPTVCTRGVAPVLLAAAARRLADAGR
jgi:beta-N-acetylhexosaminidase